MPSCLTGVRSGPAVGRLHVSGAGYAAGTAQDGNSCAGCKTATNIGVIAPMRKDCVVMTADERRRVERVLIMVPRFLGKEGFEVLVENGWYVLSDTSARGVRSIADQFESDPDAANMRMHQWVRDRVDGVEAELTKEFPYRAGILADAFAAHRQGSFNLSVPVLIAQTDGIWHERTGHNLFSGDLDKTLQAALGERVRGGVVDRLLQTLTSDQWKLRQSKRNRPAGFSDLNRHQVLHGEVTDYGTEENSLKAIALLHFSHFVLRRRAS